MKEYLKVVKNATIAAVVAGVVGSIYGLIRNIDVLLGANRFIYILGLILITFSIFSNLSFFPKAEEKGKLINKEELHKKMKEKKEHKKQAPKDYLRAATVMLIAILLESVRFYVL